MRLIKKSRLEMFGRRPHYIICKVNGPLPIICGFY